jgi:hypothetical protein
LHIYSFAVNILLSIIYVYFCINQAFSALYGQFSYTKMT